METRRGCVSYWYRRLTVVMGSDMRPIRFALSRLLLLAGRDAADNATVAPFTLPDAAGKPVPVLGDKNQKAVVVAFIGTECPVNNAYMPVLAKLHGEFKTQDVGFVAINSNRHDTAAE